MVFKNFSVELCSLQRIRDFFKIFYFIFLLSGVISHGLSVPLQVPGQPPDLTSNYWPRLQ